MKEIWKDINFTDLDGTHYNYTGYYQVSNLGNIRSLDREVETIKGNNRTVRTFKGKEITLRITHNNYYRVGLCRQKEKRKFFFVHRLVAFMFLGFPDIDIKNNPQINHKDENGLNNNVENLEWVTAKENCNYGTRNERMGNKLKGRTYTPEQIENFRRGQLNRDNSKFKRGKDSHMARAIVGVNVKDGSVIEFECIRDTNKFFNKKTASDAIGNQLRGKCNTSHGYKWFYKENYIG